MKRFTNKAKTPSWICNPKNGICSITPVPPCPYILLTLIVLPHPLQFLSAPRVSPPCPYNFSLASLKLHLVLFIVPPHLPPSSSFCTDFLHFSEFSILLLCQQLNCSSFVGHEFKSHRKQDPVSEAFMDSWVASWLALLACDSCLYLCVYVCTYAYLMIPFACDSCIYG